MSNNISFWGNVVKDAELKVFRDKPVLKFAVANNVGYGDHEMTNFFACELRGPLAELMVDKILKGRGIEVIGLFKANTHNDKTYLNVNVDRFVLTDKKPQSLAPSESEQEPY